MKKLSGWLAALLASLALPACAGGDETFVEASGGRPGGTFVQPLTQEQDILIGPGEWAPVTEPTYAPDFIAEDGGLPEKYQQVQYHGDSDDHRACYSSRSSAVQDTCYLPKSKNIHLKQLFFQEHDLSFIDYSHEQLNYLPLEQFNWVLEEFQNAILHWNGTAGFNISGSSGTQSLYIMMADPSLGGSSLASGGLVAGFGDHVLNATFYTAPNGEKEARLRSANVSSIELNAYKIVNSVWNTCGPQSTVDYEGRVRRHAFAVATHEFLHAMGFNHFYAGIMHPNISCDYSKNLRDIYEDAEPFWEALGTFNPTSPGGVGIWQHTDLNNERPNG
jgi:hypothetical protein